MTTPAGIFLDTAGNEYTIADAVLIPQPPVIPPSAISSGMLNLLNNWKQEQDAGVNGKTSKVTAMSNVYDSVNKLRTFMFSGTGKPGLRWSNSFAKDTTHFNFCYRGLFQSPDYSQIQQIELDMNQSMPNGFNVFLCTQLDSLSGTVQYTTTPSGACHWNNSNVKQNFKLFPVNTWIPFAIYTHQDGSGNVVYDGINLNGIYSAFAASCKGLSWIKEGWPSGTLINNIQINAVNNPNVNTTIKFQDVEVVRW